MRLLIVNADDFGLSLGVSRGIAASCVHGIVRNTTVMMNLPNLDRAAEIARNTPELHLGVHLVLTAGRPVLPLPKVQTLVDDDGSFHRLEVLIDSPERVDLQELHNEWSAQIDRFVELFGYPDHLDSHHFVHLIPPFFSVFAALAAHYALPIRFPLNHLAKIEGYSLLRDVSSQRLQGMLQTDERVLRESELICPDHFIGDFYGAERIDVEYLVRLLERLPEGTTELMCHPAFMDEGLLRQSLYTQEREKELVSLTDRRVMQAVADLGIQLVDYSSICEFTKGIK